MATVDDIARDLFLGRARINELIAQNVITRRPKGYYDLEECRKQYLAYIRKKAKIATTGSLGDIKREKMTVEVELRKLELAREQGMMVRATDLGPWLQTRLTALRARLISIGGKIAATVRPDAPAEAQAIIDAAVSEALEEISTDHGLFKVEDIAESVSDTGEDLGWGDEAVPEASTQANGKSVGRRKSSLKSRSKRRARTLGDEESGISARDDGRHKRSNGSHYSSDVGKSGRQVGANLKRRRILHPPGSGSDTDS